MILLPGAWRRLQISRRRAVDAQALLARIEADGGISPRLLFLTLLSCAVATLGLRLDSAAVVVGAMLIAPLLGPIALLGLALARADAAMAGRGALALLVSIASALAAAALITWAAPVAAPTREILLRTQPGLPDLAIALLGGLAAGYALVRDDRLVMAGVAIATALMPPLAIAGWALARLQAGIGGGAAMLAAANVLGLVIGFAIVAAWYGLHLPARINCPTSTGPSLDDRRLR